MCDSIGSFFKIVFDVAMLGGGWVVAAGGGFGGRVYVCNVEWLFGGFSSISAIIHDLLIRQLSFKIVLILSKVHYCNTDG